MASLQPEDSMDQMTGAHYQPSLEQQELFEDQGVEDDDFDDLEDDNSRPSTGGRTDAGMLPEDAEKLDRLTATLSQETADIGTLKLLSRPEPADSSLDSADAPAGLYQRTASLSFNAINGARQPSGQAEQKITKDNAKQLETVSPDVDLHTPSESQRAVVNSVSKSMSAQRQDRSDSHQSASGLHSGPPHSAEPARRQNGVRSQPRVQNDVAVPSPKGVRRERKGKRRNKTKHPDDDVTIADAGISRLENIVTLVPPEIMPMSSHLDPGKDNVAQERRQDNAGTEETSAEVDAGPGHAQSGTGDVRQDAQADLPEIPTQRAQLMHAHPQVDILAPAAEKRQNVPDSMFEYETEPALPAAPCRDTTMPDDLPPANHKDHSHQARPKTPKILQGEVLHRKTAAKVTKSRPRPRGQVAPNIVVGAASVDDLMNVLKRKITAQEQQIKQQAAAELHYVAEELASLRHVYASLEQDANTSQEQNSRLRDELQVCDKQIVRVCGRVRSLAKRVSSQMTELGRGLRKSQDDAITLEDTTHRRYHDDADEIDSLLRTVGTLTERLSDTTRKALEGNRELEIKVGELTSSNERLERELGDKVGLLAEERDRIASLDTRLKEQLASWNEVETSMQANTTHLESLVDNMKESTAASNHSTLTELIGGISRSVEELAVEKPQSNVGAEMLKKLLEQLSQSMQASFDALTAKIPDVQNIATQFQENVAHHVGSLKEDIKAHEDVAANIAAQEKTIATQQERLSAKEAELGRIGGQLEDLSVKEATLQQTISGLQANNTALLTEKTAWQNDAQKLSQTLTDNAALRLEIETGKPGALALTSQLDLLAASSQIQLKDIEDLQRQLAEARQVTVPDFESERAELIKKAREDVEHTKKEIGDAAKKYHIEQKTSHNVQLARMGEEKKRAITQHTETLKMIEALNTQIEKLKEQRNSASGERDTAKFSLDQANAKVQQLEVSLREKGQAIQDTSAVQLQMELLTSQVDSKDSEINKLSQELSTSTHAKSTSAEQLRQLQRQLDQAQTARQAAEDSATRLRSEYQQALEKTDDGAPKQRDILQQRIQELETASIRQKEQDQDRRMEAEQSFIKERNSYRVDLTSKSRRLDEAGEERRDLISERDVLQQKFGALQQELISIKSSAPPVQSSGSISTYLKDLAGTEASSTYPNGQTGNAQKSPIRAQAQEVPKVRKKVDRNTNTVQTVNKMPPPGPLRGALSQGLGGTVQVRNSMLEFPEPEYNDDSMDQDPDMVATIDRGLAGDEQDSDQHILSLLDNKLHAASADVSQIAGDRSFSAMERHFQTRRDTDDPPSSSLSEASSQFVEEIFNASQGGKKQQSKTQAEYVDEEETQDPYETLDVDSTQDLGKTQHRGDSQEVEPDSMMDELRPFPRQFATPNSASKMATSARADTDRSRKRGGRAGSSRRTSTRFEDEESYDGIEDNDTGDFGSPGFINQSRSASQIITYGHSNGRGLATPRTTATTQHNGKQFIACASSVSTNGDSSDAARPPKRSSPYQELDRSGSPKRFRQTPVLPTSATKRSTGSKTPLQSPAAAQYGSGSQSTPAKAQSRIPGSSRNNTPQSAPVTRRRSSRNNNQDIQQRFSQELRR